MKHLSANSTEDTNEKAIRRDVKKTSGPEAQGIEVVEALYGAVLVSQLENEHIIVLRENDKLHNLEAVTLP